MTPGPDARQEGSNQDVRAAKNANTYALAAAQAWRRRHRLRVSLQAELDLSAVIARALLTDPSELLGDSLR